MTPQKRRATSLFVPNCSSVHCSGTKYATVVQTYPLAWVADEIFKYGNVKPNTSEILSPGQWLLIALYVTRIAPKLGMKRRDVWLPGGGAAKNLLVESRVASGYALHAHQLPVHSKIPSKKCSKHRAELHLWICLFRCLCVCVFVFDSTVCASFFLPFFFVLSICITTRVTACVLA